MKSTTARSLTALLAGALALGAARADTASFDRQMQPILEQYLKIHAALAADSVRGVDQAAREIGRLAPLLKPEQVAGEHAGHFRDLPQKLGDAAKRMRDAKDLSQARAAFKELSKPMAMWATMSSPADVSVVYCSMAKGSWLQREKEILNPYHGSEMLHCGEVVAGVGASAAAPEAHGGHTH